MKILNSVITICMLLASANLYAQDLEGEAKQFCVANGKLYVGGYFKKADRRVANNTAMWDGTKWATLGKGVDGTTTCIATTGSNTYVSGDFTYANKSDSDPGVKSNKIAMWDGTTWHSLGNQTVDRSVNAIVADGDNIYVGGNFTKVGGTTPSKGIALYNAKTKKWDGLGGGNFDRAILAMCKVGNDLYVGGIFTLNGDEPAARIAKWDGKAWTEVGNRGLNQSVKSMATDGKNLYVGGSFSEDGSGNKLSRIAMWDGSKWNDMGGGLNGDVSSIFVDGDKVYVAGSFTGPVNGQLKGNTLRGFAMWDGSTWTTFPEIQHANVKTAAVMNGVLYIGGLFDGSNEHRFDGIAKYADGKWVKLVP